ncbi:unnamed protein product, partial [Brachionus calyciflorus]
MNYSIFFILSVSIALITFPIQKTNALSCFVGGAGIFTSQQCPAGSTSCEKIDTNLLGIVTTVKSCSISCSPGTLVAVTTSCCSTDN